MNETSPSSGMLQTVFEHTKRPEWGVSVIAWEQKEKRGYLFQDGQLRILSEAFYANMRPVERPEEQVAALNEALRVQLHALGLPAAKGSSGSGKTAPSMSFSEQLSVFKAEYPGGFANPEWLKQMRGEDVKPLKRHRNPSIANAQAKLTCKDLDAHLERQEYQAIWTEALAVLRKSDLVPASELSGLTTTDPQHCRGLAKAVRELLYGDNFDAAFERYLSTLKEAFGISPSFHLATALTALVHPNKHVCVQATSFREQAKRMGQHVMNNVLPTASSYARMLGLAKLLSEKLTEQENAPADLMDVRDFICITTRPAARRRLAEIKGAARSKSSVSFGNPE